MSAGLVDDGPHCALVMRYYKGGTVSALIGRMEYMEVPLAYRLELASQVIETVFARCTSTLHSTTCLLSSSIRACMHMHGQV